MFSCSPGHVHSLRPDGLASSHLPRLHVFGPSALGYFSSRVDHCEIAVLICHRQQTSPVGLRRLEPRQKHFATGASTGECGGSLPLR